MEGPGDWPCACDLPGCLTTQTLQAVPGDTQRGLTSSSGPRVDAAGLGASGLSLCGFHWQRSDVGVISSARGLQGQDILGEPFVEPGPRPLPDLRGGESCLGHRTERSLPSCSSPRRREAGRAELGRVGAGALALPSPADGLGCHSPSQDSGQPGAKSHELPKPSFSTSFSPLF